jgi:predicted regulator of amino acid metabolism with ACT domain
MLLQKVREREVNARIRIQDFEVDAFLQERTNAANPNANINIANMDVGNTETVGSALMCISTTTAVSKEVIETLRTLDGITSVTAIGS